MKTKILLLTLALSAPTCFLTAQDADQPPDAQRPPDPQAGPPGYADRGEHRGPRLLPPRVAEQLNLSPEQRAQVTNLEAEVKAKMEKILTPEQLQQLKQMRPPMREGAPGRPNLPMGGPGIPGAPNPPMGGPGMPGVGPGMPGGPNRPMGAPGMARGMGAPHVVNPLAEALDLNHDGIIEAEELAKASESLKKLDQNGDGKLTPDEFRPPRLQGPRGFEGPPGAGLRRGPGGPGAPGGEGLPQQPPPEQ